MIISFFYCCFLGGAFLYFRRPYTVTLMYNRCRTTMYNRCSFLRVYNLWVIKLQVFSKYVWQCSFLRTYSLWVIKLHFFKIFMAPHIHSVLHSSATSWHRENIFLSTYAWSKLYNYINYIRALMLPKHSLMLTVFMIIIYRFCSVV